MENNQTITKIIQAMLAPGLMISACGLLLLGINNKYSLIVNRIRLLNMEKRVLVSKSATNKLDCEERIRLKSILSQMDKLLYRIFLVRNGVLSYFAAIAFVILSSLLIGIEFLLNNNSYENAAISFFFLSILSVFIGIVFAGYEVILGNKIIKLEVEVEE